MRASFLSFLLLAACAPPCPRGPETAGSEPTAGSEVEEVDEGLRVDFTVEDGELGDIARILARMLGEPVVLGPGIEPCISLTVMNTQPTTPDRVVELVAAALEGSGVVLERTPAGVVFRRDPSRELVRCTQPVAATADVPPPAPPVPAAAPPAADEILARVRAGIREQDHTISRAALQLLLDNQAALMRIARILPREENGRVVGIVLYGIRRTSILGVLGFENGDLVRSVNRYSMTSPDSALEAYSNLTNSDRLDVELTRRGTPMTVRWRIVD
jgi:hypothetical protein